MIELVRTERHLRTRAGLGNGYCNYKRGVRGTTGGMDDRDTEDDIATSSI